MALKISTRTVNGVGVVDCTGRVVFGDEASQLRDIVKDMLSTQRNIVINLSGVSYIDSGGRIVVRGEAGKM